MCRPIYHCVDRYFDNVIIFYMFVLVLASKWGKKTKKEKVLVIHDSSVLN